MKKESGIILAAGAGLLAVIAMIALRKFLNSKHSKYNDYYSDFHRHFDKRYRNEENHGVEFLAMQ